MGGTNTLPDPGSFTPMSSPPPQVVPPPQVAQVAPPQPGPSPDDMSDYAAAVHHSRLAHGMNAVADILGGSKTLRMMKNPDGSVDVQQVDSTPGEKWGRIASAALKGAATGFAVGQGPGGAARAFAASVPQAMAEPQAQQDKMLETAQRASDQNQKKLLFQANMASLNQKAIKDAYDMQQSKIQAGEHEEDRGFMIQKSMDQAGAKMALHINSDGDPNKMMETLAQAYNGTPELQQAHHDGRTVFFRTTDPKTGLVNGGDIYIVPEDQMDKRNTEPWVRKRLVLNPKDPDGEPVWSTLGTIEKGGISYRDQMTTMQLDDTANNQLLAQYDQRSGAAAQAKIQKLLADGQLAQARAAAAAAAADRSGTWSQVEMDGDGALLNNKTHQILKVPGLTKASANGGAVPVSVQNAMQKNYIKPANDVESTWQVADSIYNQYKALRAQGKDFPTGAESMLLLSRHLQTTFGAVPGGRMTKALIEEHLGARGVSDQIVTAFQRAYDGDALSPAQWKAFHGLIHEQRNAKWQELSDGLTPAGMDPKNYLPEDLNGRPKPKVGQPAAPAPTGLAANVSQAAVAPGAPASTNLPAANPNPSWPVHDDGKGHYIQWNGTAYAPVAPPAK